MQAYNPSRILYGSEFRLLLREAAIVSRLGSRAILITNANLARDGTISTIRDSLENTGIECILFDDIGEIGTSDMVDEAASLASGGHAGYVIGVGSSTALDFARAVSIAAGLSSRFDSFLDDRRGSSRAAGLKFLAIPTRCWNPHLFSDLAGIIDTRDGAVRVVNTGVYPDSVFFLSGLLNNLTAKQVMYDLLCIFLNCIEATHQTIGTIGYPFLIKAFELAVSILRAIPTSDSPPDRGEIQSAGLYAAWFSSSPGIGFALGRSAHNHRGVSPEWIAAALLPEITGYLIRQYPKQIPGLLTMLGLDASENRQDDTQAIDREVRSLTALADVPLRLSDLGVDADELIDIADSACNICGVDGDTLLSLMRSAL